MSRTKSTFGDGVENPAKYIISLKQSEEKGTAWFDTFNRVTKTTVPTPETLTFAFLDRTFSRGKYDPKSRVRHYTTEYHYKSEVVRLTEKTILPSGNEKKETVFDGTVEALAKSSRWGELLGTSIHIYAYCLELGAIVKIDFSAGGRSLFIDFQGTLSREKSQAFEFTLGNRRRTAEEKIKKWAIFVPTFTLVEPDDFYLDVSEQTINNASKEVDAYFDYYAKTGKPAATDDSADATTPPASDNRGFTNTHPGVDGEDDDLPF